MGKHAKTSNLKRAWPVFLVIAAAVCGIAVYQAFGAGGTDAVTGSLTVNHYCVFTTNVDSGGITLGGAAGLNPASNTVGTTNSIAVTDTGNLASNILASGSNWNSGGNNFNVANTIYAAASQSTFTPNVYSAANANQGNAIRLSGASTDTTVVVNTVSANTIWFGVAVPAGQAPGTYTQTINVISSC